MKQWSVGVSFGIIQMLESNLSLSDSDDVGRHVIAT